MSQPIVLVPGLFCTPRLFAAQIPALWQFGPVTVADHRRHPRIEDIARSILTNAPPQFVLVGLSMGGYIAFEILRQAAQRVTKLALLDTSARPDTPEQTAIRQEQIASARAGGIEKISRSALPMLIHHKEDERLRQIILTMAIETGPEAFIRQQQAIISRSDSRPLLASITCPTLVLVGANDRLTPPERAEEMAVEIKKSKYSVIPECGHASTLEQPQLTTEALSAWLNQKE